MTDVRMVVVLVDLWVDEMGFEMVGKKVVVWVDEKVAWWELEMVA